MLEDARIVIVDDDPSVREATTSLFRSIGIDAVAVASAEQFLNSGWVDWTSCLVVDIQMPGMDGLRLQHHLATAGRHVPIVFITAYPDETVRARGMEAGAICFLTKPFSDRELFESIRSALSRQEGTQP